MTALLIGWMLDLLWGDPAWLPHPVVLYGRTIARCEHWFNRGSWRMLKGALVAVLFILLTFLFVAVLLWWVDGLSETVGMALRAVLIFFCLAGTTLIREVRAVFSAADRSLEEGRRQVARIVGRDTSALSDQEVRTAALETLAENLSDGVVAPFFWLMLLGVPGMMAYKMVNTLDSMIGYHSERYLRFGCWAARIDDVANYLPARLTSGLMLIASLLPLSVLRRLPRSSFASKVAFVHRYGRCHASPNSGYPEAALAAILDCQFGGPHYYFGEYFPKPFIGSHPRTLTTMDMHDAVAVNRAAEVLMVVLVSFILYLL